MHFSHQAISDRLATMTRNVPLIYTHFKKKML